MPDVLGRECRFALYTKSTESNDDIHLIKYQVHLSDGTIVPEIQVVKNRTRPSYVERKGARTYKELKEWVPINTLDQYNTTQTNIPKVAAKALGKFQGPGLRDLLVDAPYVYGAEISTSAIIKKKAMLEFQATGLKDTPYTYAVLDTETNGLDKKSVILICTVSMKSKMVTYIQKSFLPPHKDPIGELHRLGEEILGERYRQRGIVPEFHIVDDEITIVKESLKKLHEWKPDFVGIFNMTFDIDKILDACERADVKPESIFPDPSIPEEYRRFRFKKGLSKRVTSDGDQLSFKPSQRWNTVFTPASFYFVDPMCAYRNVRPGAPEEPSYSLDYLAEKEKVPKKLKFAPAEQYEKSPDLWHEFMQKNYPFHYVIYNQGDNITTEELEEATKDVTIKLPIFARSSDFFRCDSQPKKIVDELHWFCEKRGLVPGCVSNSMVRDVDKMVVSVNGLIVMLPAQLVDDSGLCCIEESPLIITNIHTHAADLDIKSSYPTNGEVFNASRKTTVKELVSVGTMTPEELRMQTLNHSGGVTNATEFCTEVYKTPKLTDWDSIADLI